MTTIRNSETEPSGPRRRGRRPGRTRCVIHLRERSGGKVRNIYSVTIFQPANVAMKILQETFGGRNQRPLKGTGDA